MKKHLLKAISVWFVLFSSVALAQKVNVKFGLEQQIKDKNTMVSMTTLEHALAEDDQFIYMRKIEGSKHKPLWLRKISKKNGETIWIKKLPVDYLGDGFSQRFLKLTKTSPTTAVRFTRAG